MYPQYYATLVSPKHAFENLSSQTKKSNILHQQAFCFSHQHKLQQLKSKVEKLRNIQIKAFGKDYKQAVSETSDGPLGRASLAKLRARRPNAVHDIQYSRSADFARSQGVSKMMSRARPRLREMKALGLLLCSLNYKTAKVTKEAVSLCSSKITAGGSRD